MKKVISAVTLSLLSVLILTSCSDNKTAPTSSPPATPIPTAAVTAAPVINPEVSPEATKAILYQNQGFGISLEFPADWKGKYLVYEESDSLLIYSKNTQEADEYGYAGELFGIKRQVGELITKEDINVYYSKGRIIAQGNGYTYISSIGNGYNGPWPRDKNPQLYDEYLDMFGKRDEIVNTAKLLGTKKPEPSYSGYRVIGSSFFTADIPEDWDVKASPDSIIRWDIFKEGSVIGKIEIIPCYSEQIASDSQTMREYILDDSKRLTAEARISLSTEKADKATMEKIKNSFKLVPNDNTIVVLQSKANKYVAQGGSKIFGRFESFIKENGLNVSMNIRLMKYVADGSAKGYYIEDLNQTAAYPIGLTVEVVAPIGPDYKSYRSYGYSTVDAGTKEDLNKETYYDFIIYDGKIEMLMARYLP